MGWGLRRRLTPSLLLLAVVAGVVGAGVPSRAGGATANPTPTTAPFDDSAARNGTYQVACDGNLAAPKTVTFVNGNAPDPAGFADASVSFRSAQRFDATGDGKADTVVELVCLAGAGGRLPNVVVMTGPAARPTQAGLVLGMKPGPDSANPGQLVVWNEKPLPTDARCCPSKYARDVYAFRDGQFVLSRAATLPASAFTAGTGATTPDTSTGTPSALTAAQGFFSIVDPTAHEGRCFQEYLGCPATTDLTGAMTAYRIRNGVAATEGDQAVVCRCPYGVAKAVTYTEGAPLPGKFRGQRGYEAVKVDLDYGDVFTMFVLAQKGTDGTWRAVDTYCPPEGTGGSGYANRMTDDPQPCAGSTTGPVAALRPFVRFGTGPPLTCTRSKPVAGTVRTTTDYSACAVTPELAPALEAWYNADPFCRCQNTPFAITYSLGGPVPSAVAGKGDYAVVDARFEFRTPYTMSYLMLHDSDRWLVADIYCKATPTDADPYANRLTATTPTTAKPCAA